MTLKPDFNTVKEYVRERLEKELDPRLCYHDIRHTLDDVLPATARLAEREDIGGEDLNLLLTGALFHDIGYMEQYDNNEPIAVQMAEDTLPGFGYTPNQIEVVSRIILATRMPQKPSDLLEEIMCDADLDSLGRNDFFILSMKLHKELCTFSRYISVEEWPRLQLAYLESHTYFTNAAKTLRNEFKRKNIEELRIIAK